MAKKKIENLEENIRWYHSEILIIDKAINNVIETCLPKKERATSVMQTSRVYVKRTLINIFIVY